MNLEGKVLTLTKDIVERVDPFERMNTKLNMLIVMMPTGFVILAWLILSKD